MRVWQPGGHLTAAARGAKVDDWSWQRTARRDQDARDARRAVQAPDGARAHLAARRHGDRARPARTSRSSRSTTASRQDDLHALTIIVALFVVAGVLNLGDERRADVLHGLDGRADPRRPAQHALPPPAAAVARLLRAQPRGRHHQPAHERRRGARPARDRRRDDARPEHALPARHGGHPLLPRLAARARDADGDAAHVRRDGVLPRLLGPRLPRRAGAARPRDGDARRGHQRHARRPGVPPRADERAELPRGQRPLPRGEPADGRPERALLPVRRLPLGARDGDRPRLRRLSRLRRQTSRSARSSRSSSTCRTSSTRSSSSRSSTTRSSRRSPRSTTS